MSETKRGPGSATAGQLTDEEWNGLTTVAAKLDYYRTEGYFRESLAAALDVLGSQLVHLFQRLAVLVIKPDALGARQAERCISYLEAHRFRPVHCRAFRYNRIVTRELWRYWSTIATIDRLELSDLVQSGGQALIVFLVDEADSVTVPASVRLQQMKGSAYPEDRGEHHLRSAMSAPNRIVVLVHSPDEPIDVIRELGILYDRGSLRRLYATLRDAVDGGKRADVEARADRLYASSAYRTLDVESATASVLASLERRSVAGSRGSRLSAGRAAETLHASRTGTYLPWRQWAHDLRATGIRPSSWPAVLCGTQFAQHDVPGASCLITESGRERWLAGAGVSTR